MISDPNTWYTVAFLIFFGFLGRTLWRMSTQLLDEKTKSIRNKLEDAARMKKEAVDFLALAKQKQKEAQQRGCQILALTEREIQRIQLEAIQERKEFVSSQERQLKERLENLENAAFKELNETIIQTAIISAEKALKNNIDNKLDSELIQDRINMAKSLQVPLAS